MIDDQLGHTEPERWWCCERQVEVVPAADLDALQATQTELLKEMEQIEAREKGLRERIAAIKPWTWQEDGRGSRTYLIRVQDLDAALAEKGKE